ncbi:DUF2442 domain-containing protein [Nocardioides sp. P86]|uniref:DUF2442 domain-containing protein n=1 Tax=Nocardioides sp. P86 TaxID=2939569 RepID=UPI00203A52C2|nr:DUF2442 domain-containing protein [Nocardioides sp. P86]MCM3516244.1 DUF2442 domain-containing protein [Nocardioides sp. P86]
MPQEAVDPFLISVTGVRVLARYYLELTFDTGDIKVIDMELLMWGPVFEPLRADYLLFCQVAADPVSGTVVWPNGADWAPDELYSKSKAAVPD